jgi:hypothetical protein
MISKHITSKLRYDTYHTSNHHERGEKQKQDIKSKQVSEQATLPPTKERGYINRHERRYTNPQQLRHEGRNEVAFFFFGGQVE